jgi:8-amino-7-oxononanoate synthase
MASLDADLNRRLAALRQQGLRRALRRVDSPQSPRLEIGGRALLNFSSNDYLGLANDPLLKQAAIRAIERFGAGAGAARLVSGSLAPHHELEAALAHFKGTAAALSFSSGYATAIGTLTALLGRDDVVIIDKLVHASIVDAARLSGAKLRVFGHNDLEALERILKWRANGPHPARLAPRTSHLTPRTLIVTESVFSMDGDQAPLREIVALKERYGAWLMLDEAHAVGLYGKKRRGLAEQLGVADRIEIQMGTLGKALGAAGGYVCGSRALIDFLVNRARSFIFSTAPVPAAAAAATAGIQFVQSRAGEERRQKLWARVNDLNLELETRNPELRSAIIPIVIGNESKAVKAAAALQAKGIFVPAIRHPSVARGAARLRVTVTAAHSANEVSKLARALRQIIDHKS